MNSPISGTKEQLLYIRSPEAIRERAERIFELGQNGKTHFKVDLSKLSDAADLVCKEISQNYPDLEVPFHSRMRHFEVLGESWNQSLRAIEKNDGINALCDLTVLSVLLDAGSGPGWKYIDPNTGQTYSRSEGLAVASLRWFEEGAFSTKSENPHCVHTSKLRLVTQKDLEKAFQVSAENPLEGVEGRVTLLNRLGEVLESHSENRISDILGSLSQGEIEAVDVLQMIQDELGDIWPGRLEFDGVNLGDVWNYDSLGEGFKGLVPFHKLSQWLAYSIIDVLISSGSTIGKLDRLTGLPEYRNGGLFIDTGVIGLRDLSMYEAAHHPSSELVIEWRALTIVLLDRVADEVRKKLNKPDLELCSILQGGTWSTGRKLAQDKRGGKPPIQIISDGTVF